MLPLLSLAAALTMGASALPQSRPNARTIDLLKPPAFFLAGDSTTAVQSSNGGGWGNGFLSFLKSPAWGINYGHNGATTVSFVKGGDWANVLASVKNATDKYNAFVTIQFGHNDQKAAANISLDQYQANLENLANQVKAAGGTPILLSPLTRRQFPSDPSQSHNATDSLHNERLRTIAAGAATDTRVLDLNQASLQYVDAIGDPLAQAYDLNGDDRTHLNDWGSVVFGRLVADLLLGHPPNVTVCATPAAVEAEASEEKRRNLLDDLERKVTELWLLEWIVPNKTLSYEIWHGIPA